MITRKQLTSAFCDGDMRQHSTASHFSAISRNRSPKPISNTYASVSPSMTSANGSRPPFPISTPILLLPRRLEVTQAELDHAIGKVVTRLGNVHGRLQLVARQHPNLDAALAQTPQRLGHLLNYRAIKHTTL